MLPLWNLFLIITTFLLSLLGTFLVRSGILSSVHAFAVDPGRGSYILVFMALVIGVSLALAFWRSDSLHGEPRPMGTVSRESGILLGNALFTACCVMVFLGTLYPLFLDLSMDQKITVAAPYFNGVVAPVMLVMLVLMVITPLLPWRKIAPGRLVAKTRVMLVTGAVAALAATLVWPGHWQVGFVAALSVALLVSVGEDIYRRLMVSRAANSGGLLSVLAADSRHFIASAAHIGAVVIAVGLIGSGLFRSEQTLVMAPGDRLEIAGETAELVSIENISVDNYRAVQGVFRLIGEDVELRPEKRRYPVSGMVTTEAAIHSTLMRDFYLVLAQREGQAWGVLVYVNPLVQLIWWGTGILLVSMLSLLFSRRVVR